MGRIVAIRFAPSHQETLHVDGADQAVKVQEGYPTRDEQPGVLITFTPDAESVYITFDQMRAWLRGDE